MSEILGRVMVAVILFYKSAVSPLLRPACRFVPTCSEYGIEAIRKYGPFKGGWLTLKRFASCHPWGRHGHDPVP